MRGASVFLQHSVVASDGDREGTPVGVLEAGAAGVPVVATRHEGISEAVVDGETGLLVDEGDVERMGDALVELMSDPERARRLGAAGRRRVESFYSTDRSIEGLWAILQRSMNGTIDRNPDVHP
jgi:glycosyltransferase involved in cell wall biosynthesis